MLRACAWQRIGTAISAPPPAVCTANGGHLAAKGWTRIPLNGRRLRVLVTDDTLSEDLIIGSDVLSNGQARIDFTDSSLHWLGRKWTLHTDESTTRGVSINVFDTLPHALPHAVVTTANPRPRRDRRPAAAKRRERLDRCERNAAPPPPHHEDTHASTDPLQAAAAEAPAMETEGTDTPPQPVKRAQAASDDEGTGPERKRQRHRYNPRKRRRSISRTEQPNTKRRECLGTIAYC